MGRSIVSALWRSTAGEPEPAAAELHRAGGSMGMDPAGINRLGLSVV